MIQVALEFTGESKRHLAQLERETPRTFRAAVNAASNHARNRLRKVLREGGGHYGVPKFAAHHQMTTLLHPGRQMLGILADKNNIVKYRKGDGQVIGWVDGANGTGNLAGWASSMQGAARYEFKEWQKSALHRNNRALDGYQIPAYYDRPARPVIDPFAAHLQRRFPGMVLGEFNKAVESRLKKGKAIS